MQRISGYAQQGNVTVTVAGLNSTNVVEGSYPGCTVSVFAQGTQNLATIYSDNGVTLKANPFLSSSTDGSYFFYAAGGRYDIQFSGVGITTPFTIGDVLLFDLANITTNVTMQQPTAATAGANQSSFSLCEQGNYWTGAASATDQWCWQDVLGAGANPTSTFTLTHTGSPGTAAVSLPPLVSATVNGVLTAGTLLGMPVAGTTAFPTIASAYAALSAGQCMAISANYTETLTANLTFGTSNTCILALGRATITQGAFQVIVSPGVNGFYMASLSPPGPLGNGTQGAQIAFIGYTGTAEAFKIGAAGSNTTDIDLRNVYVSLVSAGAGAIGFALYRTQVSYLEHDSCFTNGASNNQICYLYDAKDGFSTHKMQVQCFCNGGTGAATGQVCMRQTGNVSNSGGGGWMTGGDYTLQGSAVAGTICFDILTGDTWLFNNSSCENSILGLHVGGSTQNIAVEGYVRFDSTVGTVAQFDVGSAANHIITNNNGTVVDNGNANSVETPDRYQMNTRLWSTRAGQLSGAGDYVLFDTVANKARLDISPASGTGRTAISGDGGGDVRFNVNSGTGGVLWFNGAGVLVATLDSTGKFTTYDALTTAGLGIPAILGATSQKAETQAADANVLTVTPAAVVGTYRACTSISVTSATAGVISWTLSWTDSSGNAQSNIAQQIFQMGTAAPNTTFTTSAAGNYYGCSTIDVNNAAANIIVKWVGGGTSVAKMSATIERLQ